MKVLVANELKIGNLLYNDNVIVKIDARSIFDIWDDKGIKNYKPILLTEEWFRKLPDDEWEFVGFGNRLIVQHNKFKSIKIEFCQNEFAFYFNDELINLKQYIHESQNLFFALTGEELTLNKTNDK